MDSDRINQNQWVSIRGTGFPAESRLAIIAALTLTLTTLHYNMRETTASILQLPGVISLYIEL